MPAQQHRTVRIVLPAVALDKPLVEIGIAVGAPERAAVVTPHVHGFYTVAVVALVPVFSAGGSDAEQPTDQFVVDAGAVPYANGSQIHLLAAGEELKAVAVGDLLETQRNLLQFFNIVLTSSGGNGVLTIVRRSPPAHSRYYPAT
jgi:hypothetical protein